MIELIVRGVSLDLFKSEVFALSKAVSKLGEFSFRHGDKSVTFKIPSTSRNSTVFRYLSQLNNANIGGAFERYEGEVRQDDSVLSSGFFQVKNISPINKEIELVFLGGNSDWFDDIKTRFINEEYLNTSKNPNSKSYTFQELNHKFEPESTINSWGNEEGYVYFPADNAINRGKIGNSLINNDFQIGVFQHTIVKKIFDSVGIKTVGSLFNDPLYYQTLVNLPTDLSQFSQVTNNRKFMTSGGDVVDNTTYQDINFPTNDYDPQWNGSTFTSTNDSDSFEIQFQLLGLRGALTVDSVDVRLVHTYQGVLQPDIDITPAVVASVQVGQQTYLLLDWVEFVFNNVQIGDSFQFLIKMGAGAGIDEWKTIREHEFDLQGLTRATVNYQISAEIAPYDIKKVIPKIKQADFIKDLMFRHGVISQYDNKTRTISFDKYDDIKRNILQAPDFSNKIDLSKDPVFDFTKLVSKYNKVSFINYKEDEKDINNRLFKSQFNVGLGDGKINIDNDNLTEEGEVFESVFSATIQAWTWSSLVGEDAEWYLPTMEIFKGDDTQELNARLLINAGEIPVSDFNSGGYPSIVFDGVLYDEINYAYFAKQLLNNNNITQTPATTGLDKNLNTLSFENIILGTADYMGISLLDKNYSLFKDVLNRPIRLEIYLNLTSVDIQNIDFLTPIFLDFSLDRGYWYIDEISQYKGDGTTTKVILVKL